VLISAVREGLCLDYANTLSWRGSRTPIETLHDLAGLLGWIERSAGADAEAAREIRSWACADASPAAGVFTAAIAMREVIFRIFSAVAFDGPVRKADFAELKSAVAKAPARKQLVPSAGGYAWRIEPFRPSVEDILAPVLWAAADLLLNAARRRIRHCANERCLWLFVDESKNGARRWCDMTSCGNRAKARRHYSKVKHR
jgi:predicted RNA-binding Zn ribbon-like protein